MSSITLNYNNRTDTIDIYDITKNYPNQNVDINGYNLYQSSGFKRYEYDVMLLYNNTYDISTSFSQIIENNKNITIYIDNHLGEDISFSNINLTYFNYIEQYSYIENNVDNNISIYNSILSSNVLYTITSIVDEDTSNIFSIFDGNRGYDGLKLLKNSEHCIIIPYHSVNRRIYKLLNNSYINTLYSNDDILNDKIVFINNSFESNYYDSEGVNIQNELVYSYNKYDVDNNDLSNTIIDYIDNRFIFSNQLETIQTVPMNNYMNIQSIDVENEIGTYIYSSNLINRSTTAIELYGSINNNINYKNHIIFKPNINNSSIGKVRIDSKIKSHKLNTNNIHANNYIELYNSVDSIKMKCNHVSEQYNNIDINSELSIIDTNANNNININVNDIYTNILTLENIYPNTEDYISIGSDIINNDVYSKTIYSENIVNNELFHSKNILLIYDSLELIYPLDTNKYVKIYATNSYGGSRTYELIETDINVQFDSIVSDPRFKHYESSLNKINSINCVRNLNSYRYKYKKEREYEQYDYGFMADEVEKILPDAVITKPCIIDIENISCIYSLYKNIEENRNELILKKLMIMNLMKIVCFL